MVRGCVPCRRRHNGGQILAQIEGDRGIAPLANSQDIQVNGITVDVTAKTGAEARIAGWKQAQKEAWKKLGGPDMPIDRSMRWSLPSLSGGSRSGQSGTSRRWGHLRQGEGRTIRRGRSRNRSAVSAPAADTRPGSGGVRQVFEVRGPWQRAWAEFQASSSPVDYVRPTGSGGESLILTAGQASRRSRLWWRSVLGQFNASDVVMPVARLERQWPGGPIKATFTARHGPDNTFLGSFTMQAATEEELPRMLEQAVVRVDGMYRDALSSGALDPDPSINAGGVALDRAFAELREKLMPKGDVSPPAAAPQPATEQTESAAPVIAEAVSVQFASPDAASVDSALAAVRGVPGAQGAAAVSLAIGGTSVMRVMMVGGGERLAAALRAQGWKVSGGGSALRISR
ncbi:heavy-metal-associated domain-containing protein [Novosphingobium panipatense]